MKVGVFASVVCAVVVWSSNAAAAKVYSLPKGLALCQRNDDVCLLKAIQGAIEPFKSGISKLGVLPIDPLRVNELLIDQGDGPVSIKLTFKNQDILGIKNAKLTRVKGDFKDKSYHLEIDADIPQIILIGDYVIGGRVLVLPIQGVGQDNLTLSDFKATLVIDGHVVTRQGEDYVVIDTFDVKFKTSHMHMVFQNLFNGDKRLGDNMNVFLNENWEDILNELKPAIQDALGAIFKEISNRMYSKVPYKRIHLL